MNGTVCPLFGAFQVFGFCPMNMEVIRRVRREKTSVWKQSNNINQKRQSFADEGMFNL